MRDGISGIIWGICQITQFSAFKSHLKSFYSKWDLKRQDCRKQMILVWELSFNALSMQVLFSFQLSVVG